MKCSKCQNPATRRVVGKGGYDGVMRQLCVCQDHEREASEALRVEMDHQARVVGDPGVVFGDKPITIQVTTL